MYGQGIYFATDSSKSARDIYTKGSNKLLLCKVLLGRALELKTANNQMTGTKLKQQGYDSVFAPRGSAVQNDEFVIFDPRQALVKYIIHFEKSLTPTIPKLTLNVDVKRIRLEKKREFDPNDPYDHLYK